MIGIDIDEIKKFIIYCDDFISNITRDVYSINSYVGDINKCCSGMATNVISNINNQVLNLDIIVDNIKHYKNILIEIIKRYQIQDLEASAKLEHIKPKI